MIKEKLPIAHMERLLIMNRDHLTASMQKEKLLVMNKQQLLITGK